MKQNFPTKYRGKRRDNGKWAYGYYIQKQETTYCFKEDYDAHPDNTKHYILWDETIDWGLPNRHLIIDIDPDTLCQFTGKYDKNHKEIYINDIVKTKYGRLCIVKWFSASEYCGFDFYPIECDNPYPDKYDLWDNLNLEVIGNVFDNTGLLKM